MIVILFLCQISSFSSSVSFVWLFFLFLVIFIQTCTSFSAKLRWDGVRQAEISYSSIYDSRFVVGVICAPFACFVSQFERMKIVLYFPSNTAAVKMLILWNFLFLKTLRNPQSKTSTRIHIDMIFVELSAFICAYRPQILHGNIINI